MVLDSNEAFGRPASVAVGSVVVGATRVVGPNRTVDIEGATLIVLEAELLAVVLVLGVADDAASSEKVILEEAHCKL
jgi:hypothetical protein